MRATRGYQSDYEDRSRQWEDHKASGPAKENEEVSEAVAVAEVEALENREKNHGRAAADSTTYTRPHTPPGILQRQRLRRKEAIRSRLGELRRLLNNRKGSLSATYKKTAEANDRAYDMNQRTIRALEALAEEYTSVEVSMKKVTSEHEEGDVLYATVTEATDELEPAQKDQDRLCKTNWIAPVKTWPPLPGSSPTAGPRKKRQLQRQAVPSEKSARNELPTRRSALKLGKHGKTRTT